MAFSGRNLERELQVILRAARRSLGEGDKASARRLARHAARLAPRDERPWMILAAASAPKAGLAYIARALDINPSNTRARKAIRWLIRQLQPTTVGQMPALARMPESLELKAAPLRLFSRWTPFSLDLLVPALAIVIGLVIWYGSLPADAGNPRLAGAPVSKATRTPTPTQTPSATPTPTATPTVIPTETPIPSPTPTAGPDISWEFTDNPEDLMHEGRWIDVDLGEQRVTAYDGGSAIRSFVTSTGTWQHPTVTGQFRVYVKLRATDMSGPGYYLPGVPYTMYFYRGYAIHGTYWHNNFGTPMSHGCVNMRTSDAEWIFNFASVGTLVNVHP